MSDLDLLSRAEDRVLDALDDFHLSPCLARHWARMVAEAHYYQVHLVLRPDVDLSEVETPTLLVAEAS